MRIVSLFVSAVLATLLPSTHGVCLKLVNNGNFKCPINVLQAVSQGIYPAIQKEAQNAHVVDIPEQVQLEYSQVLVAESDEPEDRRSLSTPWCNMNECTAYHSENMPPGYFEFCDMIGCEIPVRRRGLYSYLACNQLSSYLSYGSAHITGCTPLPVVSEFNLCQRWEVEAMKVISSFAVSYAHIEECAAAIQGITPTCTYTS